MKFLSKARILYNEISNDIDDFLVRTYSQSRTIFSKASPFGHIKQVLNDLFQLTLFYVEDSISELNVREVERDISIYSLARLSGHDAYLGKAAEGKISVQLTTDAPSSIGGSFISIPAFPKIKSKNNNLTYTVLQTRPFRINADSRDVIELPVIQGEFSSQTFVSTGEKLQSFNIKTKPNYFIDEFDIKVFVNDLEWTVYDSLYDIPRNSPGVLVKTGVGGGLDIFFGNEYFGEIPERGSIIKIEYIEHLGQTGNLFQTGSNELKWEWEDSGTDSFGNEVDLNEVLIVNLSTNLVLGANSEDPAFTRVILNSSPKSNVLANPGDYIWFLNRLNYFAYVDAYTTFDDEYLDDDNVIYIFAIPDITKKLTSDNNYFTTSFENFYLDTAEETRILASLASSGRQALGTEIQFVIPEIKRYVLNIYVTLFDEEIEETSFSSVRTKIIDILSQYFLYIKRKDRIPKSDIIRLVDAIPGIDSVDRIEFISEENEKAIREGFYIDRTFVGRTLVEQRIEVEDGTDPMLGLDPSGNIKIGRNELPLIRGDFRDRSGVYYEEVPDSNKRSSLNVFLSGRTKKDNYLDILQKKYKEIEDSL